MYIMNLNVLINYRVLNSFSLYLITIGETAFVLLQLISFNFCFEVVAVIILNLGQYPFLNEKTSLTVCLLLHGR